MDAKQIIRAIAALVIKVAVAVLVVLLIYRLALAAYTFGFRIFAEEPISEGEGITVSVAITEEDDVRDIGRKLYDKGLIRSTRLFYFQELFSNYHGIEQPGVHELSTSMTVEEMLEELSKVPEGSSGSDVTIPTPFPTDEPDAAGADDASANEPGTAGAETGEPDAAEADDGPQTGEESGQ